MGLKTIWKSYRVLIVMGTSLGLIHLGWYNMKSSDIFKSKDQEFMPEPPLVTYAMQQEARSEGL
uniref:Uncharacterized protein n=1 Tax=Callorhinchus milii TaxID=7868 RepID=A0A4W3H8D1_CALMI